MKKRYCRYCNIIVSEDSRQLRFCTNCADKVYKAIGKALLICTVVGSVFAILFSAVVFSIQSNYDGTFYGSEMAHYYYLRFVNMKASTIYITAIVLFFIPFGVGLDAAFLPEVATGLFQRKIISHQFETWSTFKETKGFHQGSSATIIFKWILCTIFAPIIIILLLFHRGKLKRYLNQDINAY